jgi:hypothetical protein
MTGRTDYITEAVWTDIIMVWYCLVDDAYKALEQQYGAWRQRGPAPVFTDSEVITVALVIDTFFGGHEALGLSFLRQYHMNWFPHLPREGHFNERRARLGPLIDQVRGWITRQEGLLSDEERMRLIDSAPIFVNTYARGSQSMTLTGPEYFGVAKSQGAKLFGLRLVLTTSPDQVVDGWMLAPASLHDSTTMSAALADNESLLVCGDGAYHSPGSERILAEKHDIHVLAPPRKDSRTPWPEALRQTVNRLRRNIETALGVLAVVFHVERPNARSLQGLVCRISTRILAYNLCFVMDKYLALLAT